MILACGVVLLVVSIILLIVMIVELAKDIDEGESQDHPLLPHLVSEHVVLRSSNDPLIALEASQQIRSLYECLVSFPHATAGCTFIRLLLECLSI